MRFRTLSLNIREAILDFEEALRKENDFTEIIHIDIDRIRLVDSRTGEKKTDFHIELKIT